jgi:hypothetical protein
MKLDSDAEEALSFMTIGCCLLVAIIAVASAAIRVFI